MTWTTLTAGDSVSVEYDDNGNRTAVFDVDGTEYTETDSNIVRAAEVACVVLGQGGTVKVEISAGSVVKVFSKATAS